MSYYIMVIKSEKYEEMEPISFVDSADLDTVTLANIIEEGANRLYPKYDLYVSETHSISYGQYIKYKDNCSFKDAMIVLDKRVKEIQKERRKNFWKSFIRAA